MTFIIYAMSCLKITYLSWTKTNTFDFNMNKYQTTADQFWLSNWQTWHLQQQSN